MTRDDITLIASIGANNELGRSGDLCWHIREDLRHFRELTTGHPVIMGRKTWESLPKKPLPGRLNIVISTRDLGMRTEAGETDAEPVQASTLEEALKAAAKASQAAPFIIGGASVYSQALPCAGHLELTRILADDPLADTFFPPIDPADWRLVSQSEIHTATDGLRFRYETYLRNQA